MSDDNEKCGEVILNGWHLKKEVTIGQFATIVCIFVSGLWWASSVETRLASLYAEDKRMEEKTELLVSAINEQVGMYQKSTIRALGKIDRSIVKLGDKIDKKADK